jgi:hypothetical protein
MVFLSRGRLWSSEVIMCPTSKNERSVNELLRDPLIRLVMDSDGVTEQAMIGVLEPERVNDFDTSVGPPGDVSMRCVHVAQ